MQLHEYLNLNTLDELVAGGYIYQRKHPTLPLSIYNYSPLAQIEQHWPHEVCACRGLIVHDDGTIVSRSQYKFFNLSQPSTIIINRLGDSEHIAVVDTEKYIRFIGEEYKTPLTITRKMDGQMGVLWNHGDQWGIATRGSFESEGAQFATDRFQKFVKYGAAKDFIPQGWTLIFEIIAKHLRIVIPYDWEGLCLLTAVNNETGEEMSYDQLHALWTNLNSYSKTLDSEGVAQPGKPWCRIVDKFDIALEVATADESMDEEGYVVAVNRRGLPPVKAKIKLAEYCRLHRILTNVTPQMIWAEMARPMDVWLQAKARYNHKTGETIQPLPLPANFTEWLNQWQRGIVRGFHENLVKAIKAEIELCEAEEGALRVSDRAKFRNDADRKAWLASPGGGGYAPEIVTAAILLHSKLNPQIVKAYDVLWKLARPHGRDDKFFIEGKGE